MRPFSTKSVGPPRSVRVPEYLAIFLCRVPEYPPIKCAQGVFLGGFSARSGGIFFFDVPSMSESARVMRVLGGSYGWALLVPNVQVVVVIFRENEVSISENEAFSSFSVRKMSLA